MDKYILLAQCKDQLNITAFISSIISQHGSNILHIDHFAEYENDNAAEGKLYLRFEFDKVEGVKGSLETSLKEKGITYNIFDSSEKMKIALFVSKEDHAFNELLLRVERGEMPAEIVCVVSNHETNKHFAENLGIPFYHVPSGRDKEIVESEIIEICDHYKVDLIVLAKYMQILTSRLVSHYKNRIINIHHSFLPSFVGANPYKKAWERGVKLVGATSHYVTEELDEGPIIEQDVIRINHRYGVNDLRKVGRHVESMVLAQAVEYHTEHKVIITEGNKTIVFS